MSPSTRLRALLQKTMSQLTTDYHGTPLFRTASTYAERLTAVHSTNTQDQYLRAFMKALNRYNLQGTDPTTPDATPLSDRLSHLAQQ